MTIYICNYKNCYKTFRRPSKLRDHHNIHVGLKPFKCPANGCGKSYSTASHLRRHSKCHIENQPVDKAIIYTCSVKSCGVTFTNFSNLERHEKQHSSLLYCEKCRFFFKTPELFSKHMKRHEVVLNRKCRYCGEDFSNKLKKQFLRHEKKHTYLKCEICGRTFPTLQVLHRHLITHESEFECAHCGVIFRRKQLLRNHIQSIHIGFVSPYVCKEDGCTKIFHYKRNLNKHLVTHHKEVKFKCPIANCERILLHKKSYNRHLKLHQQNRFKIKKKKREKVDIAKTLVNAICD